MAIAGALDRVSGERASVNNREIIERGPIGNRY
jgi:hypothetical protein